MGAEDGGEDDQLILTAGCFLQGVDFVLACIEKHTVNQSSGISEQ